LQIRHLISTIDAVSRTKRKIPKRGHGIKWLRTPRHKWKLVAGIPTKQVVTDWDDKHVAAVDEVPKGKK
jgi:hypothetical protein